MEWRDLRPEVKYTIKSCFSLCGVPLTVKRSIGQMVEVIESLHSSSFYLFSEESYRESVDYLKDEPAVEIERKGDGITYKGVISENDGNYRPW